MKKERIRDETNLRDMNNKTKIRIIIPCYNEETNIHYIFNLIQPYIRMINYSKYEFSYLFIDDGSTDRTIPAIKQLISEKNNIKIEYLQLSRNFGKESAMYAGMEKSINFDAIIFIDADGQDNPNILPSMIQAYEQGYDDVYGKRVSRTDNNCITKILSDSFYSTLNLFSKYNIPAEVGDFRLLSNKCIRELVRLKEKNRYTKGIFSFIGFNKIEIPFERLNRIHNKSKWNLTKKIGFAINAYINFSPIIYLFPFYLSILLFISTIIFSFYNINNIFINTYTNYLLIFLGLIVLNFISIFATITLKILNMILEEVKDRPIYIEKK